MRITRTWTDEDLIKAVLTSDSFVDVLRKLNLSPAGGNHKSLKIHFQRLNLDTKHFTRSRSKDRALRIGFGRKPFAFEDIFKENSKIQRIVKYIKKFNIFPYVCDLCGNTGRHNNKPLVLQVDHRNGVRSDNRINNLRYLCPNCHSQTSTFAGRNNRRKKGIKIKVSKIKVPYELLAKSYKELGTYLAVARKFKVSDVTVKKAVICIEKIQHSGVV